jgi:hypothetical protein
VGSDSTEYQRRPTVSSSTQATDPSRLLIRQHIFNPCSQCLLIELHRRMSREQHHVQLWSDVRYMAGRIKTIHDWHRKVQYHQVWIQLSHFFNRNHSIFCLATHFPIRVRSMQERMERCRWTLSSTIRICAGIQLPGRLGCVAEPEVKGMVGRTRYQAGSISRLERHTIPALMHGIVEILVFSDQGIYGAIRQGKLYWHFSLIC